MGVGCLKSEVDCVTLHPLLVRSGSGECRDALSRTDASAAQQPLHSSWCAVVAAQQPV